MLERVLAELARYGERGGTANQVAEALHIPTWEAVYNLKSAIQFGHARYVPSDDWEIHVALVEQQHEASA